MKKYFLYGIALFTVASIVFSSCGDDVDKEKPVITIIEPENDDTLQIGDHIELRMLLSDNDKLASYKIDIHSNFNNHGDHKSTNASSTDSIVFSFSKVWKDIAGQRNAEIHSHEIVIPRTMLDPSDNKEKPVREGKYHFVVYCLDESGNENVASRNIILSYNAPAHSHED